ncbi:uncharacterized protein Z520_00550 [Fonsecaea multimorphosa CBS 102226]|uniref:Uncharacterized protein n=1 Tax=Fonsecaea multimorphosa CBS 102226 TaxID=1442371 RepID=A0A0D2L467_9EURO|nr:uncharacterized protein Z520_00550 [Fonsecaea multimorphosa CBS 102226]KIY03859.1 hypothetical protein Z520_00550 [Fonsecaea multimorphosa CBS 102226]OAL32548.1 hypothetical protein AYO22_00570 [Fonsecaea multimorphosa]
MAGETSSLFLHSSPLPHLTRSPDDEVPVLVQRAQGVKALDPAFDTFLVSYNHAFLDVFNRQVELIKSRSQAFEDGHVTVFDKTLLILTENGANLNNPAAIRFYCKEYLNIDIGSRDDAQELTQKLQQTVLVPETLQQELSSGKTSLVPKDAGDKRPRLLPVDPNLRKDMEPRLAVLWSVYETARAEYLAVIDKDDNDMAVKRAKFLRDTAENILLYLENRVADPLMIAELEGTFKHAKDTAVCLTGGKKRKFDPSEMDQVKGTPRGPSLPFRKKEKNRARVGSDTGGQKYYHHLDILSGYAGEMASSYGWASSDLPTAHGHPPRARYSDTYPYNDRDSHRLGYAAAPGRDHPHSFYNDDQEYVSGCGPLSAAVSRGRQNRRLSGSRTRDSADERGTPASSDYQDITEGARGKSLNPSPPRSSSPKRHHRRQDRIRDGSPRRRSISSPANDRGGGTDRAYSRDRSRRRSRSPVNDRGGCIDRAYPLGRRYEQERARDRPHPDDRLNNRGRPKIPMLGRGHSSVPYGYGNYRMVDSYVPSRVRSRGRHVP